MKSPSFMPWTKEVVDKLNEHQRSDQVHPYTCGNNRADEAHRKYALDNNLHDWGILLATEQGWVCPVCDYTQNWY